MWTETGGLPIIIVRYMLRELVPQFFSSTIIICAIIVISQLVRLSELIVTFGITIENVLLPFLYIILPFLSLTIPMAFLAAVILTFARLSADGEYAALLAAGYSLRRAAMPVILTSLVAYVGAAACGMYLEAWGRREMVQFLYRKTQTQLDNVLKFKMQEGVFVDDFLGYVLYAEKISSDRSSFENVMLAPGSKMKDQRFTLLAPSGKITGSVKEANLRLTLDYGVAFANREASTRSSLLKFRHAEIDILRVLQKQVFASDEADDDYRSYTPLDLWQYVQRLKEDPDADKKDYVKANYLFHKRIGAPFAAVTFCLFGMVLGITDQRKGRNQAFVGAIATIIGGYVLMMGFGWLAENNHMSGVLAAWMPNVILLALGGFFLYQKARLPPSEPILKWSNLPTLRRKTLRST